MHISDLTKLNLIKYLSLSILFLLIILFIDKNILKDYRLPQWIIIHLKSEKQVELNVYYDSGKGYTQKNKISTIVDKDKEIYSVWLKLPNKTIKSFRISPSDTIYIKRIKLQSLTNRYLWTAEQILKDFHPGENISRFMLKNNFLVVEPTDGNSYFESVIHIPTVNKLTKALRLTIFAMFFTSFLIFITVIWHHVIIMEKLSRVKPYVWLGLILLLAMLLRSYHITSFTNVPFRGQQTAGLIRDFYRNGINLFYPTFVAS